MNKYVILFCLVAMASSNIAEPDQEAQARFFNPDAIIHQAFEMLRWLIKNGSTDVIPVMDPLEFKHHNFQIRLDNKLLTLDGNLTNGFLRGLSDFELLHVEFVKSEIAVDMSIHFPLLTLTAEQYEMKGNIYEAIPLAGYGSLELEMSDFILSTKIYLKQSEDGQSAIIDRFHDPNFSIKKIASHTEFDGNFDDIFNALIEDRLAVYLTRFSRFLLMKYTSGLLESVNPLLNQFETWRLIAAIS